MKLSLLLLLPLVGCVEYAILPQGEDAVEEVVVEESDGERESEAPGNGGSNDQGSNDAGDSSNGGGSNNSDPDPEDEDPADEGEDVLGPPRVGDMVINEMMIDPVAVGDSEGEWVELYNASNKTVDLLDHRLADDNKDDTVIEEVYNGSLIVEPGEFALICVNSDYFDNGGVDCHGLVNYETWGGGFAMSNTEDEVVLLSPDGDLLDRVSWGEGFSVAGSALGLDEDWQSADGNDKESRWCEQDSRMSFGDNGTPGRDNNYCF